MIKPYAGLLSDLPKKWQNLYAKRYLENIVKHHLESVPADLEARHEIARLRYIEKSKAEEKKRQLPMFGDAKLPRVPARRMA